MVRLKALRMDRMDVRFVLELQPSSLFS